MRERWRRRLLLAPDVADVLVHGGHGAEHEAAGDAARLRLNVARRGCCLNGGHTDKHTHTSARRSIKS